MGWVTHTHRCELPDRSDGVAGDVWECDDSTCRKRWLLTTRGFIPLASDEY